MMRVFSVVAVALVSMVAGCSPPSGAKAGATSLAPIPTLDLNRYLGTWHEIARYPNRFQDKCVGPATAEYTRQDDHLRVVNACRLADGTVETAIGTGRRVGGPSSATLEVRFAPAWLSWIPMVWGDYWVIDLDADYQLAAISEPRRRYLWILSRQPTIDVATMRAVRERLEAKGFDLSRLEIVAPPGGAG